MRLLIDGDGCPDINDLYQVSLSHDVEMIVFIDYAHELKDKPYHVIHCEVGSDSVDMTIIKHILPGDCLVTQDYGLAGLALAKGAIVIHVSGKQITEYNIDELLFTRYMGSKLRKGGHHIKGPSKRTQEDKNHLIKQVDNLIEKK